MKPRLSFLCLSALLAVGVAWGLPARAAAADAPAAPKPKGMPYYLSSNDRIHIEVVGDTDLNTSQRIDAQGNVNLALVGDVRVVGLTRSEAGAAIQDAYIKGQFLRHPQVTVAIEEYTPRMVSISGSVKNPGRYELPTESSLSVVELVTKAGGFTDIGKGSDVRVTHSSGPAKSIQHIDVEGIIKGTSKIKADDESLILQPGDIVFVPEKLI